MNASTSRHLSIPTPGARVVVRSAEWIVRRVDHAPGGYQIVCEGVSELVRGREAVFLTALEPTIQVLDPADTRLVPDESDRFTDSILYMESQLRHAVPNDEKSMSATPPPWTSWTISSTRRVWPSRGPASAS